MYSGFAILLDSPTGIYSRKLAFELDERYHTGFLINNLPPHISLKSSFRIKDLNKIERYFHAWVQNIKPFTVEFNQLDIIIFPFQGKKTGLVWMDIQENENLRSLHIFLNRDLKDKLNIPLSGPDGESFHFHSTVCLGGASPSIYRKIKKILANSKLNLSFQVNEIAMFYSPDDTIIPENFKIYKTQSLS